MVGNSTAGSGDAGSVQIDSTSFAMSRGGLISTSTGGSGMAGQIRLTSGTADIDNSSITSSAELGSTGAAGNVEVTTTTGLVVRGGGSIATSTERTCKTFAPSEAISSISSNDTLSRRRARGTTRGSVMVSGRRTAAAARGCGPVAECRAAST